MSKSHPQPRLSIKQFVDCLVAKPHERRKILLAAKFPEDEIVIIYDPAHRAIQECVVDGKIDHRALEAKANLLRADTNGSEWAINRNKLNADAIEAFIDQSTTLIGPRAVVQKCPSRPIHLVIRGVEISVRPELQLSRTYRGRNTFGFVKLYFRRGTPLDETTARYMSSAVAMFADIEDAPTGYELRKDACRVVDVFARKTHNSPETYQRVQTIFEAACAEIGALWPELSNPNTTPVGLPPPPKFKSIHREAYRSSP